MQKKPNEKVMMKLWFNSIKPVSRMFWVDGSATMEVKKDVMRFMFEKMLNELEEAQKDESSNN